MSGRHYRRDGCRLCGDTNLTEVLSLTPTPPANQFIARDALHRAQACYPLDLYLCEGCAHVQLRDVVDPRLLFENYIYVSGTSPVFVRHFGAYASDVARRFAIGPGDLVVDIGSNDGTLLAFFKQRGSRVLGVDPARDIARRASARGIETVAGFFSPELAARLKAEHGPAALVTANNVFAHCDDLAGMLAGVRALLAPAGVLVLEVSYLADVVEKSLFDTVYHEHLAYHSVKPLRAFFARCGMQLFDVQRVSSHGGSLRAFAQAAGGVHEVRGSLAELVAVEERLGLHRAQTYRALSARIEERKSQLRVLLAGLQAEGRSIAGFGAPAKATTLMHHFGLGRDLLEFIVDDNPLKQGLYTPGLHVPVLPASALTERRPDCLVLLAWNFARPIIEKHRGFLARGGAFIVPLPELRMVPARA